MQDDIEKKVRVFREAAKLTFNSSSGKEVLAALKEDYVDRSALAETAEITAYKLGQKELVQSLMRFVSDPIELEEFTVHRSITED